MSGQSPLLADQTIEVPSRVPAPWGQVLLGLYRSLGREQGRLRGEPPFPRLLARRSGVRVEAGHVAAYREVCGFGPGEEAPGPYAELLLHESVVALVLSPRFPASPLGLVHLEQRYEQLRPLRPGDLLGLRAELSELRETRRGVELVCGMLALAGDEPLWRGEAVFLSRLPRKQGPRSRAAPSEAAPPRPPEGTRVQVPADTGRRYARVSGDWNPHHVSALGARLFGFRRPIAHGMWTLSRSLAVLGAERGLPARHSLRARFRRPVYLPGAFTVRHAPTERGWSLEALRDDGAAHLLAEIETA